MAKHSAGLLMYRLLKDELEVFLVHPGGPYFVKKDAGAWGIPKGEYDENEAPLTAARREFLEETGFAPDGKFHELGSVRQKSGKIVIAWAVEGDCDPEKLLSNTCTIEWPPRSGRSIEIPEIDRGHWFKMIEARVSIRKEQEPFLDSLDRLTSGL
jgi:predicted NUDIX family NTP pyrophosphohydrolase